MVLKIQPSLLEALRGVAIHATARARFVHADVPADDAPARLALGRVFRLRNFDAQRLGDDTVIHALTGKDAERSEIHLLGTRLFMIMEVNDNFSFEAKTAADRANPKVQEWEALMWKFQQALPHAKPGEKWQLMEQIFKLEK